MPKKAAKKAAKKVAAKKAVKKVAKKAAKKVVKAAKKVAPKKAARKTAKKAAKKKAHRTTMYSSKGKKLYAVRDAKGHFKDIQTYKRAHTMDMKRKSGAEVAAKAKKAAKKK